MSNEVVRRAPHEGMAMIDDEDLLVAVLNSAPVTDGVPADRLDGPAGGELVDRFGGSGTEAERGHLRQARTALQAAVREEDHAVGLVAATMSRAALLPEVTGDGIRWQVEAPADERLAVRTVLAWSRVVAELPGRLRACANTECNLFLVDHSRPGTARWCSMATCGNRMKARAHARRTRGA